MQLRAEWPYLRERSFQRRLAMPAADRMRASVDNFWIRDDRPPALPITDDFFDHLERLFCSVGVIAKIFYARAGPDLRSGAARLPMVPIGVAWSLRRWVCRGVR
jgi:hypothetical protein